jgi:hypothetical protein
MPSCVRLRLALLGRGKGERRSRTYTPGDGSEGADEPSEIVNFRGAVSDRSREHPASAMRSAGPTRVRLADSRHEQQGGRDCGRRSPPLVVLVRDRAWMGPGCRGGYSFVRLIIPLSAEASPKKSRDYLLDCRQ